MITLTSTVTGTTYTGTVLDWSSLGEPKVQLASGEVRWFPANWITSWGAAS